MHVDVPWLRKQLDQLRESLQSTAWSTAAFEEYRGETDRIWNDSAARHVSGRYLEPHRQATEAWLARCGDQLETLEELAGSLAEVVEAGRTAGRLSAQIEDRLSEADTQFRLLDEQSTECRRFLDRARAELEATETSIAHLESMR